MKAQKIVHIMTVGTSLISNQGMYPKSEVIRRTPEEKDSIETLNALSKKIPKKAESIQDIDEDGRKNIIDPFVENLQRLDIKYETSLTFKPTKGPQQSNRFPQEITYIFKRYENIKNEGSCAVKEEVYLLPTDTIQSKYCAEIIKEYINKQNDLKNYFKAEEPITLKYVSKENAEIPKQGIDYLHKVVSELIEKAGEDGKVYINISGGIKSLVAYITLQGMLNSSKCTICYQVQDKIIEIPSYPVGIDFHHYHRHAKRMKMVLNGVSHFDKNLSEQMKKLKDDGTNKLTTLGEQFKKRYEEQLKKATIEVYSKEIIRILLPDNLDSQAKDYREILEAVIDKSGAYIWTGDKIPEMVEHARRHHHNLIEFAELFLTPILNVNPEFINVKERFCLIAGILLHDCGHSIDFINTKDYGIVPLFASEIRELHHILAVQRLNDKQLRDDIGWISKDDFRDKCLDENIYDAVMDVCRYHRKKMPYKSSDKCFNHDLAGEHEPLECKKEQYEKIDVDIMKVVALLRIIDSCDNQSSRVGNMQEVKIALNLLRKDYETLIIRAVHAYKAYKEVCKMLESENEFKNGCNYVEESNGELKLKENYMEFRIKCIEALKNGDELSKTLARTWLTAAELIDKANMKRKQDVHYEKHQYLKEVKVLPSKEFSESSLKFDIILCPTDANTSKDQIRDELISEYQQVKGYLNEKCNLYLEYLWET